MFRGKYYDGQSAKAIVVKMTIIASEVLISEESSGQQVDLWAIADIQLDPRQPHLHVLISKYEPEASIELDNSSLIEHLRPLNPGLQSTKLNRHAFLIFVGALFALGVIFFLNLPSFSRFLSKQIPFSTESSLAKKINLEKYFQFCKLTDQRKMILDQLLVQIFPTFSDDQKIKISVQVVQDARINAYTLPGGLIILNDGLLKNAKSSNEIIGVLAHEIGHISNRHIVQHILRNGFLNGLFIFLTGNPTLNLAVIQGLTSLSFDREMELEADTAGIERLISQNISLQGSIDFFKRSDKDQEGLPQFLSTHPGTSERIQLLQKNLTRSNGRGNSISNNDLKDLSQACDK